jgi:hypothetical protein
MKFRIKTEDAQATLGISAVAFPKYTTQLMNLANSNAGGTRPKVVGQMSELIVASAAESVDSWRDYYQQEKPQAIEAASEKVEAMVENLKAAIALIDRPMVERWVRDLVVNKTYYGFRVQDVVLVELGRRTGREVRQATAEDEGKGIDGYLGELPIQVKPSTYKAKAALPEDMGCPIVYYDKKSAGISVDATEVVSAIAGGR